MRIVLTKKPSNKYIDIFLVCIRTFFELIFKLPVPLSFEWYYFFILFYGEILKSIFI